MTSTEKVRAFRIRQKAKGMKKLEIWIFPEHEQFIKNHNELLINKKTRGK